jgi:hypothetical protein
MSALARWDAFLAQIEGRHRDVRTEAFAAALHDISRLAAGGDHMPLARQLSSVDRRLEDLERKLAGACRDTTLDGDARARGVSLQHQLEDERMLLPVRVFADLARQRYKHAASKPALMTSVAAIGAHAMPQETAAPEWLAMRAAVRAKAPAAEIEKAQIAYWRAYLKARAWFEPALTQDLESEILRRMKDFYDAHPQLAPMRRNSASK